MKGFTLCYRKLQRYIYIFFISWYFICMSFIAISQPRVDATMPPLTLFYNHNTKILKTQTLNNKYVLYYIWSAKFPSIVTHIDNLKILYQQYKNTTFANNAQGLEIIFISIDRNAEEWQEACSQLGINFEYNSSNFKNGNFEAYKLFEFPRKPVLCLVEPFTQKIIGIDNTFAELDALLSANEISFSQTPETSISPNNNLYEVLVGNFVTTFRPPPISHLPSALQNVSHKTAPIPNQPNTVALTVGQFTDFNAAQQFLQSALNAGFKDAQIVSVNNFEETIISNNLKVRTRFETPTYISPPPSQIQYNPALDNYGVPILINTPKNPPPPLITPNITQPAPPPTNYNNNTNTPTFTPVSVQNNEQKLLPPPYTSIPEKTTPTTVPTTATPKDTANKITNPLITPPPPATTIEKPKEVKTDVSNTKDIFELYEGLSRREKRKIKKFEKLQKKANKLQHEIEKN